MDHMICPSIIALVYWSDNQLNYMHTTSSLVWLFFFQYVRVTDETFHHSFEECKSFNIKTITVGCFQFLSPM
jgi:hypothetical protein